MGRGGWIIVVVAGCGRTAMAVDGSEGASGSADESGAGDDEDGDPATTNASLTVSSTAADTGASDPPIHCATPGVCEGNCTAWEAEYLGTRGAKGQFASVTVSPAGEIVAVGVANGDDVVLVGYDAGGNLLWEEAPVDTDDGEIDLPWKVAVGSDDTVAIAGQGSASGFGGSWLILDARNELGGRVFEYGDDLGFENGVVLGGVVTSAFTVALAGMKGAEDDVWLASLDLENGLNWGVVFDEDPSTREWATDVAVLPDGDLLVAGNHRVDDGNALSWIGRFAPDGSNRWARTHPVPGCCFNYLYDVEVDADGRIFLLGVRGSSNLIAKVQEIDCEGEIVWEWNPETTPDTSTSPGGLAWSPHTGLVVAGTHYLAEDEESGFVALMSL